MALKLRRTTNFSEEERLLLAELGKEFPVIENKAYDNIAKRPRHGKQFYLDTTPSTLAG